MARMPPFGLSWLDLLYIALWVGWLTIWGYTEISERIDSEKYRVEFERFHDEGGRFTAEQAAVLEHRIEALEGKKENKALDIE